jgi:hypothetical protein
MARDIQEFINRDVAPTITGMDPMRIEDVRAAMLWQLSRKYFTGASGCSASLIDIALWDIKGKATGQPVWKLLGGARNRVPAYITFGLGQHTQQEPSFGNTPSGPKIEQSEPPFSRTGEASCVAWARSPSPRESFGSSPDSPEHSEFEITLLSFAPHPNQEDYLAFFPYCHGQPPQAHPVVILPLAASHDGN